MVQCSVYRLRCRIAPPGTVIPPPSSQADQGPRDGLEKSSADTQPQADSPEQDTDEEDDESECSETDDSDESPTYDFIPEECLFCNRMSSTFQENTEHMLICHSLVIPYKEFLAVELQTLIWYLHLVIHGYHECIQCGKRRRDTQAVQQHMITKGHCRFDASSEFADFYDAASFPRLGLSNLESTGMTRPDETSLRLASGKVLSHRSAPCLTRESRSQHSKHSMGQARAQSEQLDGTTSTLRAGTEITSRMDRRSAGLTLQLSSLSLNDRNSLAGLSPSEQRSALITRKKQVDKARREESRAQSHINRLGNKNLMKHFKNDVPGRLNG